MMELNKVFKGLAFVSLLCGMINPCLMTASAEETANEDKGVVRLEQPDSHLDKAPDKKLDTSLALPKKASWQEMDLHQQIESLIRNLNPSRETYGPIEPEQVQNYLGEPTESNQLKEGKLQEIYLLESDQGKAKVTLVYDQNLKAYIESLAWVEDTADQKQEIKQEDFVKIGDLMRKDYANRRSTAADQALKTFGQAKKKTYVFEMTLHHYQGDQDQEYVLTTVGDQVKSLNYTSGDKKLWQKPIKKSKQELDRMSHEAGLNKTAVVGQIGSKPMAINYDSKNGMVTYAWFSDHPDSVEEVYYYYAYNGVSIGLAYQ